jgi:hypothetical protein
LSRGYSITLGRILGLITDESVLEKPPEIYWPFRDGEVERLATYKTDVETLTRMAFFTDPRDPSARGIRASSE